MAIDILKDFMYLAQAQKYHWFLIQTEIDQNMNVCSSIFKTEERQFLLAHLGSVENKLKYFTLKILK